MDLFQSALETNFLPLVGGLLIGVSSTVMLGGLGRITGISGILASAIDSLWGREFKLDAWRIFFISGLFFGGFGMHQFRPDFFDYSLEAPIWKIVLAGLLVGYGTRLGGGCTSGHGVCGLPRRSLRSTVATLTFILTGMLVVVLVRSVLG